MPLRTVTQAFFGYIDETKVHRFAKRGETVDIPEGDDLKRGDEFGAFTDIVGEEPKPPEGSYIPAIDVTWTPEGYARWVDGGTVAEILDALNEVGEEQRPSVANAIIQAEHGRGKKARKGLLESLGTIAVADDVVPVVTDAVVQDDGSLVPDAVEPALDTEAPKKGK